MWQTGKPNWIGEFGVTGNHEYPELFHNSIWAALSAGAALTPAEWNSGGSFMQMTPEMYADQNRLSRFVSDIPLAWWNPIALKIDSSDPEVRAWGVAGDEGGLFWAQDFSTEGQSIAEVRENQILRSNVSLEILGLREGEWVITPYDTWQGIYLEPYSIACKQGQYCAIPLPDFRADMAFKVTRE
jgi:hypothetical protein